jgi:hypothetical protein
VKVQKNEMRPSRWVYFLCMCIVGFHLLILILLWSLSALFQPYCVLCTCLVRISTW